MPGELQPYVPAGTPAELSPPTAGTCAYCGAPLSEFFYFCLACATPYKTIGEVVTPARPRQLTAEELVAVKTPQVARLFWTYFGVILGVGVISYVLFREDRPDLQLMLNEAAIMTTTFVYGCIYRRALGVQLKKIGFDRGAAYVGLAVLVPLLCLNYAYHGLLFQLVKGDESDFLADLRKASVSEVVLVLTFCVTPAIFEEIAFRGLIQHWLQTAVSPWKALLTASFLFATMHLTIISFPYLFLAGMLFGWTKLRTGSLYPSMLLHFLHNFVVIEYFHFG